MQFMFSKHFGNMVKDLIGPASVDEVSEKTHTSVEIIDRMAGGWIPEDNGVIGHFGACLGKGADRYVQLASFLKGMYCFRATNALTKQGLGELEEWESREVQRILTG